MSKGFNIQIGSSEDNAFTIKNIAGCRIVYGSVPVSEFAMLTHGFSKKAVMAIDIANLMGAAFVIGEPEDIESLRKMDLPVSEQRNRDYLDAITSGTGDGDDHSVALWLRNGARGRSTDAMCKRIFGKPENAGNDHPHDPDDLSRCLAFLDVTKAHESIGMMRDVSPTWAKLVDHWGEIVETYNSEKPSKKFDLTYKLMREKIEK